MGQRKWAIVIFNKKYICGLHSIPGIELLKPLEFTER